MTISISGATNMNEIVTAVLPPAYVEQYEALMESGRNLYNSATSFALQLVIAKRELGESVYQLLDHVSRDLNIEPKTIRNYLGTMESAQDQGWYVPALTVGHHTSVDYKCLTAGEKETLLTTAMTEELSVGATRALAKQYLEEHDKITDKERSKPERTAMDELSERIEQADDLLRKCREFIGDEAGEIAETLVDEIDAWLLGS